MGKKKSHNKEIGRKGEEAAAWYLRRKGFEIIERNWVCPAGEADIIALDGDELVFCEVKTRTSIKYGLPSEAVTPEKRARYEKIAAWYLLEYGGFECPMRFDVISILIISEDRAMIRHDVNAFGTRC